MNRRNFIAAVSWMAAGSGMELGAKAQDFDPAEQSMTALQRALESGALTSEALTQAYLGRIERLDRQGPAYRSLLALNSDAITTARRLDVERRAGKTRGPLHGIPIVFKDNIETSDPMATTAGSLALAGSRHAADAPVAARLRAAGAVVLGKSNLSEWANFRSTHACSGWSGMGGQTRNAYSRDRNPSGSSAGSAVAAALSFCAGAIGTETNGSILSPASVNGLVGLKPTVGMVNGSGIVPISPRQDTAGPLCRTVGDAALLAACMAEVPLGLGRDGHELEAFRLQGTRIGVLPTAKSAHPGTARLFADARAVFEHEGALMLDLQPASVFEQMDDPEGLALRYEFKAAINSYLAGLDHKHIECRTLADLIAFNRAHANDELGVFGQEIFESAEAMGPLTDSAYQRAVAELNRTADLQGLAALFDQNVDVLLAPCNGPAELIDPIWGDRHGGGWPQIASAAAIAGYPSITVPAGTIGGLPLGIALVARRRHDGLLLQIARAYERAASARVPPQVSI